ncbi:hypothetical protein Tco_0682990 [Tanacetum coccineum]|uniref:Uncharacterized protein n=1 Tax=Tanacetum coccineum TaxID=301880 RepID=A0ABQ4XUD4_9ASTR
MDSTQASSSHGFKKIKLTIIPPKQLFVDLTNDDENLTTPSPTTTSSSPTPPNAPSKTPSTNETSSSQENTSSSFLMTSNNIYFIASFIPYYYSEDQYAVSIKEDTTSVEAEFPTIVINDAFAPQDALQCKSQVSTSVNDDIDFRISFDESGDEDYTIICDKNSFSYKMISVNNLKTDSENDNEKVIPSIPSPKPAISCFDDLDFFKDFENEFPVIVYNDAKTSKSNLLTETILSPQHIDEFDLNDETSVFEYDEEEQNILSTEDAIMLYYEFVHVAPSLATDADIADFEERLERIYGRKIHMVQVVDFLGMPELMRDAVWLTRIGYGARCIDAGRLFDTRGPLVKELILKFLSTLRFGEVLLDLDAPELHTEEEMESLVLLDFLGPPPSYTLIKDPVLRLCHRMMAHSIAGRSQAPEKVTVTDLFYLRGMDVGSVNVPYLLDRLLTTEILGGLTVIALELLIIDMGELVRLQIFAEDAPAADEGDQAVLAPVQVPQPPPPPPPAAARTMPQRMAKLEEDVYEIRRALTEQREQELPTCHILRPMYLIRDVESGRGLARPAPPQHNRTYSSQTHDPSYPYLLIKPGSKFSTIVHEYVTEPSRIFSLNARMGKRDDFKCVETEEKSNLKTSL